MHRDVKPMVLYLKIHRDAGLFVFICFLLVFGLCTDHACSACLLRVCVWCISECNKVTHGEKHYDAFYFFAIRRPVLRFRPVVRSTFIRHIAAFLALSGRRQSEYAVPAAVKGTCTG